MNKRPLSISIISWIFIILGGVMIISMFRPVPEDVEWHMSQFRVRHPIIYLQFLLMPYLAFVCGLFMFLGFQWARWLFVCWFGDNMIAKVVHSPATMLPQALLFGVIMFFLYRPAATAFFNATALKIASHLPKQNETKTGPA